MMNSRRFFQTTILAVVIFAGCLVAAQQPAAGPTPNPAPAPAPAPTECKFETSKPSATAKLYNFGTCIVARFAVYIKIDENSYVNLNNGRVDTNHSKCEGNATTTPIIDPKLIIDFDCGQLELEIAKNNSEIFVKSVNGFYKNGTKEIPFSNTDKLFVTNENGHYYKCNSEQTVPIHASAGNHTAQLMISSFEYEAFRGNTSGTDFYKIAEECSLDSGPFSDGVRIGVGVCLVAFVIIILIAYFVGRRRWSQRSSYESV